MEDLSGLDADDAGWITHATLPDTLKAMLRLVGTAYLPLLLANAHAINAGEKTMTTEVDGATWTQDVMPYQAKCLLWLRHAFADLNEADQKLVKSLLDETGCGDLISGKI